MNTTAPPNNAAAPTAPVRIAGAACLLVDVACTPPGFAVVATGTVDVGGAIPEVNGTPPEAVPALEKAGGLVPVGLGVTVVLDGFKTLSFD